MFKRTIQDGDKEYQPDRLLVEKNASRISLIEELRKAELPIKQVRPFAGLALSCIFAAFLTRWA
jgi:hypothetical protein